MIAQWPAVLSVRSLLARAVDCSIAAFTIGDIRRSVSASHAGSALDAIVLRGACGLRVRECAAHEGLRLEAELIADLDERLRRRGDELLVLPTAPARAGSIAQC